MQVNIYTIEGKMAKTLEVPENVFGAEWNPDLVAQVLYSQASNRRAGTAHTKNRAEVRGSHKKPWNQKGSGRARHGSAQSPLWKGGGVTFGPRNEKNYKKTIPRSMKVAALYSLLSAKVREGRVIFVDTLSESTGKTKAADAIMKNLATIEGFKTLCYKKANNVYVSMKKGDEATKRAFRNLPYMALHNVEDLNPLDLANTRYLVIANPEETISYLSEKKAGKKSAQEGKTVAVPRATKKKEAAVAK